MSVDMEPLLIHNGLLIDTQPEPVVHRDTDLLITDGVITAVGAGLDVPGARRLDATGLIVLPGFVDAHRHTWQTALRGLAADVDFAGYMSLINGRVAGRFRAADVHTGTLAGAVEALASGITTLQDYSHIQLTPEHADAGVSALREAGIRAVFAYGPAVFGPPLDPDLLRRVHGTHFPDAGGLVTMGLAPLGPAFRTMAEVHAHWALAGDLGLRIFTHISGAPSTPSAVEKLSGAGLLHDGVTLVHGNMLADADLDRIAGTGAAVAICPAVEARMGHGAPMAGRLAERGITTGLGVDVVTSVAGDMFSLMRATLLTSQFGTGRRVTPAEVLRMATLDGAAAVGLGDRVGSLTAGKRADLVLLRATDPNLVGGLHDPIGTVVSAAHPGNIDRVLVDGRPAGTELSPSLIDAVAASARHLVSVDTVPGADTWRP
jgi:5-methylthioadenosine/S-adenosylhomocysteine deaminase